MVAVAGPADKQREAQVIDLPVECVLVERHVRAGVGRVEIAEVPGSRQIGHLCPCAALCLPDAELGTLRIGQYGAAAALSRIGRRGPHRGADGNQLLGCGIGVVDGNVGVRRRCMLTGAGQPAVERGDQVAARRSRRHGVLECPAEEFAVELSGRVDVGLLGIDPTRHALRVGPLPARPSRWSGAAEHRVGTDGLP